MTINKSPQPYKPAINYVSYTVWQSLVCGLYKATHGEIGRREGVEASFLGCMMSLQHASVYLGDGSAYTIPHTEIDCRYFMSHWHSILTLGQPVLGLASNPSCLAEQPLNTILKSLLREIAQPVVCWARCPAWCSVEDLTLPWATNRSHFSLGVNMGSDPIP